MDECKPLPPPSAPGAPGSLPDPRSTRRRTPSPAPRSPPPAAPPRRRVCENNGSTDLEATHTTTGASGEEDCSYDGSTVWPPRTESTCLNAHPVSYAAFCVRVVVLSSAPASSHSSTAISASGSICANRASPDAPDSPDDCDCDALAKAVELESTGAPPARKSPAEMRAARRGSVMDVAGLVVVVVVVKIGVGGVVVVVVVVVVLVASWDTARVSVDARRADRDRLLLLRFHNGVGVDAGADEHETIIGQTCPLLLKPHLLTGQNAPPHERCSVWRARALSRWLVTCRVELSAFLDPEP